MPESGQSAGYILSFDFGLRRIGVAVGQTLTATASPLETIRHTNAPDWPAVDRVVKEWKPMLFVVGLPLGADGEETDMSKSTRAFGAALAERYGLPVEYADERLTSRTAQARFAEQRAAGSLRRKDSVRIDAIAAQLICENWLKSKSP